MPLVDKAATGKQGRVVLPAEIRRALDLQPDTILTFSVCDGEIVVFTPMAAAGPAGHDLENFVQPESRAGV